MKIEKYIALLPRANMIASKKITNRRALSHHELLCLYLLKKNPGFRQMDIIRVSNEKLFYNLNRVTTYRALKAISNMELVIVVNKRYFITAKGREYLFYIRRHLLNFRTTGCI